MWPIHDYLADPVNNPEIDARRYDVEFEFENLMEALSDDGYFKVIDGGKKLKKNKRATFGVTDKKGNPTDEFFTASGSIRSNRALDHIFQLRQKQDVAESDLKKKFRVQTRKTKRQFFPASNASIPYNRLSDHLGVSTTFKRI